MNYDLINIKKKYGEDMMHFCRTSFNIILEKEEVLLELISSNFAPTKSLYQDLVRYHLQEEFKKYILYKYSICGKGIKKTKKDDVLKTPKELLQEAGYDLYKCETESDIQSFKKYYAPGEALCTFNGGRLDRCHVFFAVKKNVDEIRRENFKNPERQDEYGTSVISIQFSRGSINTISIKNRYNHTVANPDATFSNNLDNIIPGLTESFKKEYKLNFKNPKLWFEIPGYVEANDGKYYKYNYEINNIYYCLNNIIIDNFNVLDDYQDKGKYIVTDYFIIDLVNKHIKLYDSAIKDSFVDSIKNIKKIEIKKVKESKNKIISFILENDENVELEIDNFNRIISYNNNDVKKIASDFLMYNNSIKNISLQNVLEIGDKFLYNNTTLSKIEMPQVISIGNSFLSNNILLQKIETPNLEKVGNSFLWSNECLKYITIDNLKYVGYSFLSKNNTFKKFVAPKLEYIDRGFLYANKSLLYVSIPSAIKIGDGFLFENENLIKIEAPNLKEVGSNFLSSNQALEYIEIPNLEICGNKFMYNNNSLFVAKFPKLRSTNSNFLYKNNTLKNLDLSSVVSLGDCSLKNNNCLLEIKIPNLRHTGRYVLSKNKTLTEIDIPLVDHCDKTFLGKNSNFENKNFVLTKKNI